MELGRQLVLEVLWDELFGEKEVEVAILGERHIGAMRGVGGWREEDKRGVRFAVGAVML